MADGENKCLIPVDAGKTILIFFFLFSSSYSFLIFLLPIFSSSSYFFFFLFFSSYIFFFFFSSDFSSISSSSYFFFIFERIANHLKILNCLFSFYKYIFLFFRMKIDLSSWPISYASQSGLNLR